MAYWPRKKGKIAAKTREKEEVRESISKQFPEAFVRAVRDTPFALSDDSQFGTPEHGYASTGVGLKELAKLQLQAMNASDLEELEIFSMAGKEALQEIQKAQTERAKKKTMDDLKDIMNRINFTLEDLKTSEKELSVTPLEDLARKERIEEEKRRRKQKKKRRRSLMKKRMTRKAERKAREKEEKDESSDEGIKETGRLSKTKEREGKITPGGKKEMKESEKMEEMKRMEGEIAEVDKEGRRTKMENISEEQGIGHEIDDEQPEQTEIIAGKKGLESEIADMGSTVHEDAEELKRQIAEGVKEIQRMAGVEAQEIEKQMAMIDKDLVQLSDTSTTSEDDFSLSSEDLEAFDSWSSMSDFSFASSEVYFSDQEEVDYDQLKKDLTAPLTPPSIAEKAEQRQETSDTISSFVERCLEREEQLLQLQSWMEAITAEELPDSFTDQEGAVLAYSPDLLEEAKSLQVQSVLEEFKNSMKKLKDIADSLGIGESAKAEEVQETPEKKQYVQRLPIPTKTKVQKVFNEEELSIPDNFSKAATSMSNILDEAMKACPSRRVRLGIAEGLKQFQFIVKVLESREDKLHSMDKAILNMGSDQVKSKRQVEDLRKAKKKMQVKCEKLENIVDDQKTKLTMTERKIEELNKVVQEYKRRDSLGLYDESEEEEFDVSSSSTSSPSFGDLPTKRQDAQKKKRKKEKRAQKRKQKGKADKKKSDKYEKRGSQKSDEEENVETQVGSVRQDELKSQQVVVKPIDVEKTEVYQILNEKFEQACNELQIERETLAQIEKQFEKIKNEKIKYVQEKIDLKIEIEQLIRKQEVETEELRDEIANYEMETKKLKSEVDSNEEMIQYQEERITQYAEEIQHLEDRMMGSLTETPNMSSTSFAQTGARRGKKSLEPPTARQMMTKIKQQYESEIQGLKDFLSKENHRFQADSRRKDQEHKREIQNIHKESMQVLRCINRFKEGAANLLDRENLSGEAHAMRKLPNLTLDESPAEIRQMLAKMAILSNELLISMELQLSKALMSKRLEVKDTSNARAIFQKDLESQTLALRKAKDVGALQANKLKVARDEMVEFEAQAFRFKLQQGEKREVLVERYKELYSEYIALKRELIATRKVEKSEREKDEEINRKEAIIMKSMRKEKALQRALEEQRKIIANLTSAWQLRRFGQYYITKTEQIQNLETLKEALHDDRIRRGPYEMTTTLIKDAIELPKKRFIELVKKYYRYVKMKEMEERVKRARLEDNLGDKFIYMLERRMQKQRDVWSKKREEFVKRRADILMQLSKVLTRISQEAEILLAQPKVLTVRAGQTREISTGTGIPDLFEAVKILKEREIAREMIPMRVASRIPGDISPPMGVKIEYSGEDQQWKLKGRPPPSQVVIATPRILDLDVNMTRIAAQEILSHVSKMPWNQASQSLPALKTFTSRKFPAIQKSLSQPAPKRGNLFGGEKRALALPPIATFYSSEDIHQHKETKINQ